MPASMAERLAAFKPEDRREVPIRAGEPVKIDKTEMAYVDTLALQTKLGTQHRMREESLSLRDSQIVQARPIIPGGFVAAAGSVRVIGQTPPPILDLAANMRRKRDPQELEMRQSPPPPGTVPEELKASRVMGSGKSVVVAVQPLPGEVREAPLVQPIVSDRIRAQVEEKLVAEMKERAMAACLDPNPEATARQKLAEIQKRMEAGVEQAAVMVVVPPAPLAVEPAPKHEPIVVEPTPFVDQAAKIAELEAENAALLAIVARLATENKTLKAKK